MAKKDSSRHTYYNRYTGKRWGDSHNYHLTLDSGALGYELCIKLIVEAAGSAVSGGPGRHFRARPPLKIFPPRFSAGAFVLYFFQF